MAQSSLIPSPGGGNSKFNILVPSWFVTGGPVPGVPNGAPDVDVIPTLSGSTVVGGTLTATHGVWSNTPTSYTYQWFRTGAPINGATSSTYTTGSADVGSGVLVSCSVTATNASGSTSAATSAVTVTAS